MKNIEEEIIKYFEEKEVPELSVQEQNKLRNLVKENKTHNRRLSIFRKITAVASALCLIALIIVPTVIMLNKQDPNPPPVYYGKAEATKNDLSVEQTQEIISSNYPKYNFIFEEFTIVASVGYYNPKNNSLLSIQIKANEIAVPYTQVEINLIASNQFIFEDKEFYIQDATYTKTNQYELYKKEYQSTFNESLKGYIVFNNYELYLTLDRINDTLFDKFL